MEAFIPSKSFQVLYDFEGTNERELTIKSGEILLAQEKRGDDDWLFVVKLKDSTKKGFVPSGFINELSQQETARYITAWNTDIPAIPSTATGSPSIARSGSNASAFPPTSNRAHPNLVPDQKSTPPASPSPNRSILSTSANSLPNPSLSPARSNSPSRTPADLSKRPSTPTTPTPSSLHSSLNRSGPKTPLSNSTPPASAQTSVMEMFAKHEAYLRQVMRQREDKFKELEKSISNTGKEIDKYKDLNDLLFQKITKLESSLEAEHGKLKQKIMDEERRAASPNFA